jgi:four helix bundle protein
MNPAPAPVASLAPTASLHRFDAYRLAIAFRAHVVRWLPLKRTELSDQLDRASISAVLNVAEGAGRAGRDQARHYAIARGSAFECLAVLDLLDLETSHVGSREARAVLHRLMAVLTALIRK